MYRYTVTRRGDRWQFRPSDTLVYFIVSCWAGGIALLIGFAYLQESFFRIVFLLIAGLLAGGIVLVLWTRRTSLTVEPGGRVCHGGRELCSAGSVRAVRFASARTGESGDYEVCLELDEGKRVYLPGFYSLNFNRREDAYDFAKELAVALGVEVRE